MYQDRIYVVILMLLSKLDQWQSTHMYMKFKEQSVVGLAQWAVFMCRQSDNHKHITRKMWDGAENNFKIQ
jgi:hypothetical protein